MDGTNPNAVDPAPFFTDNTKSWRVTRMITAYDHSDVISVGKCLAFDPDGEKIVV